jgi:AcrR family transcriptional regulator
MAGTSTEAGPSTASRDNARLAPPRAYLRSDERRRQLLDAAARIAGSEGVERLTIVGLAKAAGVSRQLVYDHFSDLQGLVGALLEDRFAAADGAIHEAISRPGALGSPEDAIEVALAAARVYLSFSREDRHILRSVLVATDAPEHELNGLALQLRGHSINRWQPALGKASGAVSRARAWALANALNGLADLVGTGELDVDGALEEFGVLLRASVAAKPAPRPRARTPRVHARRA